MRIIRFLLFFIQKETKTGNNWWLLKYKNEVDIAYLSATC